MTALILKHTIPHVHQHIDCKPQGFFELEGIIKINLMPAKAVLEKRAWEWALKRSLDRISEEDLKTAYRVNFPPCKPGSCR